MLNAHMLNHLWSAIFITSFERTTESGIQVLGVVEQVPGNTIASIVPGSS